MGFKALQGIRPTILILFDRRPLHAVHAMADCGVLQHLGLVASSGSIGHEQYEIGSWTFERAVVMPEERSRLPLTEREAAAKRREEAEMAAAEAARQPPPPPPPQQPPPPPDQPPPEDIVVDSGSGSGEAGSGFAATGDGASGSGDEVVGGGSGGGGEAASGSGE